MMRSPPRDETSGQRVGKSAPRAESPFRTTKATTQKEGVNHEAIHFFFLLPTRLRLLLPLRAPALWLCVWGKDE